MEGLDNVGDAWDVDADDADDVAASRKGVSVVGCVDGGRAYKSPFVEAQKFGEKLRRANPCL